MNTFCREIDLFLISHEVSINTKRKHQKNLQKFGEYLSQLKNIPIEEIHLLQIFTVIDPRTGQVIIQRPINSSILDHYFMSIAHLSYNQLLIIKSSLGAFFKYLERTCSFPSPLMKMNFCLKDLKPSKRPIKTFSRRDVLRFFHSLVSSSERYQHDLILFCLIFATGCRISEVLNIKRRDIDVRQGFINLEKTKSGKSQIAVIKTDMGRVLEYYAEINNIADNDYLFTNKEGCPLRYENARKLFIKYLRGANLPANHLHVTRHSFATHLFENGSDIPIIQQLLRHRNVLTTIGYVHPHFVRNYGVKVSQNLELYKKLSEKI